MFSWKSFFITAAVCSTLFAQSSIDGEVKGKIVLKDKEGKTFEITKDSKPTVEVLSIGTIDKLVLKNQYQIRISIDQKQEAVYDVTQMINTNEKTPGRIDYVGLKDENKQDLILQCYTEKVAKTSTPAAKYEKTQIACVKTSGCKSFALNSDKKFRLSDTSICTGKKEVEKSVEAIDMDETVVCRLFENQDPKVSVNLVKFTSKKSIKDFDYKNSTSECK